MGHLLYFLRILGDSSQVRSNPLQVECTYNQPRRNQHSPRNKSPATYISYQIRYVTFKTSQITGKVHTISWSDVQCFIHTAAY